jgi:hypothetical protein
VTDQYGVEVFESVDPTGAEAWPVEPARTHWFDTDLEREQMAEHLLRMGRVVGYRQQGVIEA